MSKTHQSIL